MPSITIHPRPLTATSKLSTSSNTANPLPSLLQTPLGLAIIEIQGTLNIPSPSSSSSSDRPQDTHLPIGRLVFPLLSFDEDAVDATQEGPWMKKVYFYVGENQRLSGEVRKLPRVLAVLRRRGRVGGGAKEGAVDGDGNEDEDMEGEDGEDEGLREDERQGLEIMELIRWKIVFGSRPEFV